MKLDVFQAINITDGIVLEQGPALNVITSNNNNTTTTLSLADLLSKNSTNEEAPVDSRLSKCTLEAVFGYPNSDHLDPQYNSNHHADSLSIQLNEGLTQKDYCFPASSLFVESWCSPYEEAGGETDKGFLLHDVASTTLTFTVTRWFTDPGHSNNNHYKHIDDTVAAGLTLKQKTKTKDVVLSPAGGWKHDVERERKLHEEKISSSSEYAYSPRGFEGKFSVSVSCNGSCECTAGEVSLI